MERKELEELVNYCNIHPCEECEFCKECDGISDIAGLTNEISNCPCHWSDEDIDYILDEINKEV